MTIIATKPKLILRLKDPYRFRRPQSEQEGGLTDEEYEFLLEDIENARIEGNIKYGFGGLYPHIIVTRSEQS
jgi:hypothetical protein